MSTSSVKSPSSAQSQEFHAKYEKTGTPQEQSSEAKVSKFSVESPSRYESQVFHDEYGYKFEGSREELVTAYATAAVVNVGIALAPAASAVVQVTLLAGGRAIVRGGHRIWQAVQNNAVRLNEAAEGMAPSLMRGDPIDAAIEATSNVLLGNGGKTAIWVGLGLTVAPSIIEKALELWNDLDPQQGEENKNEPATGETRNKSLEPTTQSVRQTKNTGGAAKKAVSSTPDEVKCQDSQTTTELSAGPINLIPKNPKQKPVENGSRNEGVLSEIAEEVNDTIDRLGSILPDTKVGATINLSNQENTVVSIQHPIGGGVSVGSNIMPSNLGNSTLSMGVNVSSPNESNPHTPTTSVGCNFNPSNIEASTISVTAGNSGYSGGILINPSKPKETQFHFAVPFESISVGATVNMSKPLQAHVHAEVPVTVYGVTFLVGADVPLRKPMETKVSLSIPVPGMNIYLGSVGPKKALRDFKRSLHPDQEIKHITNKVKHAAQKTCGKVKKLFRGKHKHKHKHRVEVLNIHAILRVSKPLRRSLGSLIQQESLAYDEAQTQLIKIAHQNKILLENNRQTVQQSIATVMENNTSLERSIQTVQQSVATVRENDIALQQISEGFRESGEIVQRINSTIQPIAQRIDQAPSLIEANRRLVECSSNRRQTIESSPLNTAINIRKLSTKISPEAAARILNLRNTKNL